MNVVILFDSKNQHPSVAYTRIYMWNSQGFDMRILFASINKTNKRCKYII